MFYIDYTKLSWARRSFCSLEVAALGLAWGCTSVYVIAIITIPVVRILILRRLLVIEY